jgi:hypothetical protein
MFVSEVTSCSQAMNTAHVNTALQAGRTGAAAAAQTHNKPGTCANASRLMASRAGKFKSVVPCRLRVSHDVGNVHTVAQL